MLDPMGNAGIKYVILFMRPSTKAAARIKRAGRQSPGLTVVMRIRKSNVTVLVVGIRSEEVGDGKVSCLVDSQLRLAPTPDERVDILRLYS